MGYKKSDQKMIEKKLRGNFRGTPENSGELRESLLSASNNIQKTDYRKTENRNTGKQLLIITRHGARGPVADIYVYIHIYIYIYLIALRASRHRAWDLGQLLAVYLRLSWGELWANLGQFGDNLGLISWW